MKLWIVVLLVQSGIYSQSDDSPKLISQNQSQSDQQTNQTTTDLSPLVNDLFDIEDLQFPGSYSCKFKSEDERVIEILETSTGGCEVRYTKKGVTQSVAEAKNQVDYCQRVGKNIIENLTKENFSCQTSAKALNSDP